MREAQPGQASYCVTSLFAHLPLSQGWNGMGGPCEPCGLLHVRREARGRLCWEGELVGGPSAPLSMQVSCSSPRTDFPRLSAMDISYCKVMMMTSPGDTCPCLGAGCAMGRWQEGARSLGDRSEGLSSSCAPQCPGMLWYPSWELLGERGWLLGSWG